MIYIVIYKDKDQHYFYYRSHDGDWYAWEEVRSFPAQWVRLQPLLSTSYIQEHLQPSDRFEFMVLTGSAFKRPYWKMADTWKRTNDVWYTSSK